MLTRLVWAFLRCPWGVSLAPPDGRSRIACRLPAGKGECSFAPGFFSMAFHLYLPSQISFPATHLQPFFWHFPGCSGISEPCEVLTQQDPADNEGKSPSQTRKWGSQGGNRSLMRPCFPGSSLSPSAQGRILTCTCIVLDEQPQGFTGEFMHQSPAWISIQAPPNCPTGGGEAQGQEQIPRPEDTQSIYFSPNLSKML